MATATQSDVETAGDDGSDVAQILDALDMTLPEIERAASCVEATIKLFENQRPCVTDVTLDDGTRIHKFQTVRQTMELPFGDDEVTDWVVTSIDVFAEEVTMKVPGPWDSTTVSFAELQSDEYDPLTHGEETPIFGY